MDLSNYKNADLTHEIQRRAENGSDLLDRYYTLGGITLKLYPYSNDPFRSKIRPGSKREQTLKYEASDKDLMKEIQHRIVAAGLFGGEYDAYQEFNMARNNVKLNYTSRIIKKYR